MARESFKISFTILLIVMFLVCGCQKPREKKPVATKEIKTVEKNTIDKEAVEKVKERERFVALINKLDQRNPFSRDHAGIYKLRISNGSLQLGGILYDEKKPMAIINNQIVGEGDTIDDKEVIEITPEEVILKDKEERTYKLGVIK